MCFVTVRFGFILCWGLVVWLGDSCWLLGFMLLLFGCRFGFGFAEHVLFPFAMFEFGWSTCLVFVCVCLGCLFALALMDLCYSMRVVCCCRVCIDVFTWI